MTFVYKKVEYHLVVLIKRNFSMEINGKVYFDPWVGENYESGIKGDKVLVIGLQHWCDPTYWGCDKDPHICLNERDSECTVWNAKLYRPEGLNENVQKPSGWEFLEKNIMPNCPIEKCKERSKCTSTESNAPRFRYLHCETKISVYNHIHNNERAKRASIFGAVLSALEKLYSIDFKNKKEECWNRIAFTNFIQHYTKIDPKNPNRIDINSELEEQAEKNSKALCYLIEKKHIPDVIVALNIDLLNKTITSFIKGRYHNKYFECNNISIMTPMGGTFTFSVFATEKSFLYKKIKNDLKAFVDYYICNNLQVKVNDGSSKTSDIARKIQALAEFLKEQKGTESKPVSKYRDDILKNENINKCIRKKFYLDNDYKHQKTSEFSDIKRQKLKHLFDDELERIKNLYNSLIRKGIKK